MSSIYIDYFKVTTKLTCSSLDKIRLNLQLRLPSFSHDLLLMNEA